MLNPILHWLDPSIWSQLWNINTCCLSYESNIMTTDALMTLAASASARIALTPKARLFRPSKFYIEFQKSVLN